MEAEAAETKKTSKLANFIEEHPRTIFWFRFCLWASFACILPFVFIACRFGIFKAASKLQISGLGIIAIILVVVFVVTIIRYIKLAFSTRYSFWSQCLSGLCKIVIPLIGVYAIIYNIRENINVFLQALGCVILCETVAIPLNPLPEWAYEKQKDVAANERKDTVDYLLNEFFRRKREGE